MKGIVFVLVALFGVFTIINAVAGNSISDQEAHGNMNVSIEYSVESPMCV